jgi:hypothetical protein
LEAESLWRAAVAVLEENDLGDWTRPAPRLYPHQWSWDSAFISIGLARLDGKLERALRELETLFAAQWSDGRVPHIVFNPASQDYFPGADWWASAATRARPPRQPATSGLIQPPVHAIALGRIVSGARAKGADDILSRAGALYPRVLEWHRYLARHRDTDERGLLVIYHPWESGTDNSPRWDEALARVNVGKVPDYRRHDLKHVDDSAERPSHAEYDRYIWLVQLLKQAGYDDATIQRQHPFQVGDVLMSAIFAAACSELARIAEVLDRGVSERDELKSYAERFTRGVEAAWDESLHLGLDRDVRRGTPLQVQTCAGLAPLLLPVLNSTLRTALVERLDGSGFAGTPGLVAAIVPSTVPGSTGYHRRAYWRGPAWPVINWLLWWGLQLQGANDAANRLRQANLDLLARPGADFAEYFEPFTGEGLGSARQSWTAAVALDWLAVHDDSDSVNPDLNDS